MKVHKILIKMDLSLYTMLITSSLHLQTLSLQFSYLTSTDSHKHTKLLTQLYLCSCAANGNTGQLACAASLEYMIQKQFCASLELILLYDCSQYYPCSTSFV